MKRMVKNGDLIDVEPDGSITVAGKPIGGGGENEREITLTLPYPRSSTSSDRKIYLDEETWNKIKDCYYETIKINYNDGFPLAVFHVFNYFDINSNINSKQYACVSNPRPDVGYSVWYGTYKDGWFAKINAGSDGSRKYISILKSDPYPIPNLDKSKFDALYKLADKPTGDGTYVLKATVSGGAVTYTWVAQ